jgi:hypothetical protein
MACSGKTKYCLCGIMDVNACKTAEYFFHSECIIGNEDAGGWQ